MAAPTVGAVMADILPYLEVRPSDGSDALIAMENVVGLSRSEAENRLKDLGVTARCIGGEDTVTAQIPASGTAIPFGSEVLLYFGGQAEPESVEVPDFTGLDHRQASDTAGKLGLYVRFAGNPQTEPDITVIGQSIQKNTLVPPGTTISLTFADTRARD